MAGLGKKTFTAGAVLTASDVNGYLMDQAVMVFGGTAARSSAIPSPSEGMMSYRTDDDVVEVYNGTAYVSVGGVAVLKNADVSGTTGSPTGTAFSSGGTAYQAYIFTGSGSITFTKAGLIDVLCIAGGGGGGSDNSGGLEKEGGGGAGGYLNTVAGEDSGGLTSIPSLYVSAATQTVVIGAGGSGANAQNFSGNTSFISSFTAVGGGRGATVSPAYRQLALVGGSGGGGQSVGTTAGAAGLQYQGFAGGNGGTTFAGGGGGAGAVGATGSGTTGGNGGAGLSSSINGTATTRGGGGGGAAATPGSGGVGGGGGASAAGTGTSGTVNTGGGGGGGRAAGGAGGSGIVIVRVLA